MRYVVLRMNCVVTAGPTSEPLDAVRRLTNFSTGQLGTRLADYLTDRGHSVALLRSSSAVYQLKGSTTEILPFSSTSELLACLESLSSRKIDAVFHAAAVSDFAFGKVWERLPNGELTEVKSAKISTRAGALLAELTPTPKIIARLHDLFPGAWLVGWKYEMDGGPLMATMRAEQQLRENRTHACVLNGPAYGDGFAVISATGGSKHHPDIPSLCSALADMIERPRA